MSLFLGSFFPPKQASAAGRPGETETLSAPDLNLLAPLLEGKWLGGCPVEGSLASVEVCSDVSQTLPVASDDGYDFSAVYEGHKDSLGWLQWHIPYNTTYLYAENHLSLLSFIEGVGLYTFLHFYLTTDQCGRCYYFFCFTDEKLRLRDIQATFSQGEF